MAGSILLISLGGADSTGVTAIVLEHLAACAARVLDIGQSVIHEEMNLGVLLQVPAGVDAAALTVDQTITLGGTPLEPDVIDMNGDGKLDLLVTRSFSSPLDTRTIAYLQRKGPLKR